MKKYKSDAYEASYEEVLAEFETGLISEDERKKYDEICLVQEPETAYNEMPIGTHYRLILNRVAQKAPDFLVLAHARAFFIPPSSSTPQA